MTGTDKAPTKSGWQSHDSGGRKIHTMVWLPEEYGYLAADGSPAFGSFCENCGKWEGPKLGRGQLAKMHQDYGITKGTTDGQA